MKALATGATSIVARAPFVAEFSTALTPYQAVSARAGSQRSAADQSTAMAISSVTSVVHMPTPLPFSKDIDFDDEHVCFGGKADVPDAPHQCPLMTQSGLSDRQTR